MNFAEPRWIALLAVAPLAGFAVYALLAARGRAESAWVGRALMPRLRAGGEPRPGWAVALVALVAVAGLAGALARPRWGTSTRTVERRGVDVVFVLDTSLSMAAGDVAPSRFWLAQSLIRRIAQQLPGERVALVGAEGVGVVLSPLTVDAAVLDLLLDAAEPGTLPVPGTKLAPALERALALFPEGSETHRAIVLLSDGEDHGESLAATIEQLAAGGVVLHALGVGTAHGAPIPLLDRPGEFKREPSGTVVVTQLHPESLRALADATGGLYLEVSDAAADPSAIAGAIADMPGRLHDATTLETLEERFQWPLGMAVAALALWLGAGAFGSGVSGSGTSSPRARSGGSPAEPREEAA